MIDAGIVTAAAQPDHPFAPACFVHQTLGMQRTGRGMWGMSAFCMMAGCMRGTGDACRGRDQAAEGVGLGEVHGGGPAVQNGMGRCRSGAVSVGQRKLFGILADLLANAIGQGRVMHDEVGCLQGAQGVQRQLPGIAAAGIDHDEVTGVEGRDWGRCDRRLFCGAPGCPVTSMRYVSPFLPC